MTAIEMSCWLAHAVIEPNLLIPSPSTIAPMRATIKDINAAAIEL